MTESKNEQRRRIEGRVETRLREKQMLVAPPRIKEIATTLTAQWANKGVHFGTGFGLLNSRAKVGQWLLFAFTDDVTTVEGKLPHEVDGYPVVIRSVPVASIAEGL